MHPGVAGCLAILLLWAGLCFPYAALALDAAKQSAGKGILDLRAWDFDSQGPVSLAGQWQFHWKSLVDPADISYTDPGQGYMEVPGSWHRLETPDKPLGAHGYATLALQVLLDKGKGRLALDIRNVLTAYDLFINGVKVQGAGRVGTTRGAMIPEYRHVVVNVPTDAAVLSIVMHISNFHHRMGGPWSKIILGSEGAVRKDATYRLVLNVFMVGSIFIMGLYHLCLYLLRRTYAPALFLGVFCFLITLRSLVTNEHYLHVLFPGIPWEILIKGEYIGFYLAVPVFGMFIHSLYPREFSRRVLRWYQAAGLGFSALVVMTPARLFSHSVLVYETITLVFAVYMFRVFYRAARSSREGVTPIILGAVFLFFSLVNDILHANNIVQTAYLLQAGMFVFIFTQAFVLSQMFSKSFYTIEAQARDLMDMNRSLNREVEMRKQLEISLVESHDEFKNSRIALILGLAKLAEYRDTDTGTHLERIREYVKIIATELSRTPGYAGYITDDYIQDIYHSSVLHDIGKIGIADAILLKPDKLTPKEFEIMKSHTVIGGDAITDVAAKVKQRSFLTLAKDIAYYHHERWDGAGYPKGLARTEIPLSARITSLADVYDALTSERPYKKAFSHETALAVIKEGCGGQFDPDVAEAFFRRAKAIDKVRKNLRDR